MIIPHTYIKTAKACVGFWMTHSSAVGESHARLSVGRSGHQAVPDARTNLPSPLAFDALQSANFIASRIPKVGQVHFHIRALSNAWRIFASSTAIG